MIKRIAEVVSFYLILFCLFQGTNVYAFSASSTSFYVRQAILSNSGGDPSRSYSTSTTFKSHGAGGQTAIGTSSSASFGVLSGFLRTIDKGPAPLYEQIHFHWRNDNGSESGATSATSGSEDSTLSSISKNTTIRVRVSIANHAGTVLGYSSQQFRLEYGLKSTTCSAISSWVDVGAGAGDWDMSDSASLTEGSNTTNIAVASGGVSDSNKNFISSNAGVKDTSSQTSALFVSSDSFAELEYSIKPLTAATDGGTYCFRLTNAGSTTNYLYTVYPQATVSAGAQTISFSISDNIIGFGGLTTSAARYATGDTSGSSSEVEAHQLTASTNAASGYTITVQGGTLASGGNSISAIGGTNTGSSVGSEQFGIRLTATGGVGSVTAPYAASGFAYAATATTSSQIAGAASGDGVTTTYSVRYISNIANTTENGDYSTNLIYVITANF